MKQSLKRTVLIPILTFAFIAALGLYYFNFAVYGDKWATYPANRHIYTNGVLTKAGVITDANNTVLASTQDDKRVYNKDKNIRMATVHAVGDKKGYIATGIQAAYLDYLCGYDIVNGIYNISGEGNNIELTLDSQICVTALKALGNNSGTVGIYNYETGEIICMVSTPTFDPESEKEPSGKGVYMNRFLSGVYAPGSIFKLVTALSALENVNDVENMRFSCSGGVTIGGEWLSCLGRHGELGIKNALMHSCNAFFAQTALKVGRTNLTKTAQKVGFNKTLKLDGIPCAKSRYDVGKSNDIDFGWSGIGQYTDLVNPYQYLTFMGGIANGGKSVTPHIVRKITAPSGFVLKKAHTSKTTLMSGQTAEILSQMMRNNVIKNYGDSRFSGLEVCGKTGTAEVGDNATPHSWFTGFCKNPDTPYAFTIIVENAGAGNGAATRIASTVLKRIQKNS